MLLASHKVRVASSLTHSSSRYLLNQGAKASATDASPHQGVKDQSSSPCSSMKRRTVTAGA